MKILYHHRTQMDDAQGIHIIEIIKAFQNLSHKVRVFSLVQRDEKDGKKNKGKQWEVITRIVPNFIYEIMEIAYNFYAYLKLISIIKKYKPDFIYERYAMYNFCGILAAKHANLPIILEVNAPLYLEQISYEKLSLKKLAKKMENWICNHATKTIVVSSTLRDILVKQGVNEKNLLIMPNGINQQEFNINRDYTDIRKLYSIDSEAIVIGVVGWFREWHGLDFLIQTCYHHNLFKNFNVHLLFVGDGPSVNDNQRLVKKLKIEKHVTFTGKIDRKEIPNYIGGIDIALQPKVTTYASPMKIFEYMTMRKAIIAPDQQNIREILIDGENALLFEPENNKELFEKIQILIQNIKLRKKIGHLASKTINDKGLYWTENAKKIINLVNSSLIKISI